MGTKGKIYCMTSLIFALDMNKNAYYIMYPIVNRKSENSLKDKKMKIF